MVGALYAAGMSAADLEREALGINVLQFFELRMIGGGVATGKVTQHWVNEHVGNRPLEGLRIPFVVAATRPRDSTLTLFNHGDTGLAVRASSASPGQFEPVRIGSESYVDGDEASPVPIRAARSLGAKFVIAVDVSAYAESTPKNAPIEWVEKDTRRRRSPLRRQTRCCIQISATTPVTTRKRWRVITNATRAAAGDARPRVRARSA